MLYPTLSYVDHGISIGLGVICLGGYYIPQNLDWGEHFMGAIEAISGFIDFIGNILELLSRIGESGGKDETIIKDQGN